MLHQRSHAAAEQPKRETLLETLYVVIGSRRDEALTDKQDDPLKSTLTGQKI